MSEVGECAPTTNTMFHFNVSFNSPVEVQKNMYVRLQAIPYAVFCVCGG
jgi:hypothetical protein